MNKCVLEEIEISQVLLPPAPQLSTNPATKLRGFVFYEYEDSLLFEIEIKHKTASLKRCRVCIYRMGINRDHRRYSLRSSKASPPAGPFTKNVHRTFFKRSVLSGSTFTLRNFERIEKCRRAFYLHAVFVFSLMAWVVEDPLPYCQIYR